MTRTTNDVYDEAGVLQSGYDYTNQAWVMDGKYVACGHPDDMNCKCYGKVHEGEPATITRGEDKPFEKVGNV
jgi:hypothetical protein